MAAPRHPDPHRQLLGLLRRPPVGRRGDGRRRADRRAHRRLAGRADDADPQPDPRQAAARRLRRHVRHPDGAGDGDVPRPGHQGRVQRRRARPGRLRRGGRRGGRSARAGADDRLRRRRRPDATRSASSRKRARCGRSRPASGLGDVERAIVTANAYLGCWGIVDALASRRRHRHHRPGHRRRRRRAGRRRGTTAGRATTGTRSPARSSPAT